MWKILLSNYYIKLFTIFLYNICSLYFKICKIFLLNFTTYTSKSGLYHSEVSQDGNAGSTNFTPYLGSSMRCVSASCVGMIVKIRWRLKQETHNLVKNPHLRCGLASNPLSIVFYILHKKLQGPVLPEMKLSTEKSLDTSQLDRVCKQTFL